MKSHCGCPLSQAFRWLCPSSLWLSCTRDSKQKLPTKSTQATEMWVMITTCPFKPLNLGLFVRQPYLPIASSYCENFLPELSPKENVYVQQDKYEQVPRSLEIIQYQLWGNTVPWRTQNASVVPCSKRDHVHNGRWVECWPKST